VITSIRPLIDPDLPVADSRIWVFQKRVPLAAIKEETRAWIRNRAGFIRVGFMLLGGILTAFVAVFLSPSASKTLLAAGVGVLMLAFAAFFAWARFPMPPRKASINGIPTLTISEQLKRTHALFQRIMLVVLVTWCVAVTLSAPKLTALQRNGTAAGGGLVLFVAGWLLVRYRLRCPRCGTDFRKERIAKLGRWSMDTRGTTELWEECPHCGVSFNGPYR
jgi:ribosomal protein S27AE